ncbi:MAG: 4Fe-4S binding protein [Chloroflexia bacterium]|nr:4Fe-4S binding protein [Chloroflexia bacterium]
MARRRPKRQSTRQALLLIALLIFPLTLYYFSPVLIIQGAAEGVVNGSMIVFGLMFLSALFVGRLWCGWFCPAGGLQEITASINERPATRAHWLKWLIWLPWMGVILLMFVQAGGIRSVEPLYQLRGGLTLLQDFWYIIYYFILLLFLLPALIIGRRASCHYICWMAPFMILGRRLRNLLAWPSLRLRAEPEKCNECRRCNRVCPMSLDVLALVQKGSMEHDDCILCGSCVDNCPKDVLHYSFSAGLHSIER